MSKHLPIFQMGSFGKNTPFLERPVPTDANAAVAAVSAALPSSASLRSQISDLQFPLASVRRSSYVKQLSPLYHRRNAPSSKNINSR